jgi:hypothetical protein
MDEVTHSLIFGTLAETVRDMRQPLSPAPEPIIALGSPPISKLI